MIRALSELFNIRTFGELATLVLFLSMIAVWAKVLG